MQGLQVLLLKRCVPHKKVNSNEQPIQ